MSKERLEELRMIIREKYGRELTDRELFEIGNGLVNYFSLLGKIDTKQGRDEGA